MRAAVFDGKDISVSDVDEPEPGPGEVLVKVAACGVCHTDLHYIDHGVPTFKSPPIILGHEVSGTISEPGGSPLKSGARVILPAVISCGRCIACRTGRENICDRMRMFGNHMDGGYAEYVAAPAKEVIPLPDGVPLKEGSIIADAMSTPFHAVVNRARVSPGDIVVIVGCGGVGINAIQFASVFGAEVIAVDINRERLDAALEYGAAHAVDPSGGDLRKEVKRLTGGRGADIAIEVVGRPETIRSAFSTLRKGGRLCIVGYSEKDVPLPASRVMFFEMDVVGSLGCRNVDYPRIIGLVRSGRVRLTVTGEYPLERIGEAFDALRGGVGLRNIVVP